MKVMLNRPEAAEYLGIQTQTLAAWASLGRYAIPYYRIGKSVRYRVADLDAWLEQRRTEGTTSGKD
jgi:excisionase family DNA binding protein